MQFVGVETGARSKAAAANVDRKAAHALTLPVKKNGFILTGQMAEGPCLAVIDFDLRQGQVELPVAELPEACQKTMLVRTGSGGLHAYFYVTDGEIRNSSNKNARNPRLKGVDVRGEGGIIFAPGCKFDEHPHAYAALQGYEPATIDRITFHKIVQSQLKPEVILRVGFTMILDGRLKIEHLIQHQTQVEERFYWRGFFAEVIAQGGVPEDYYKELTASQPEFNEKKTRDQMKAPSNQQYLARQASPLEYYKLFRGIDPAVVEPAKLGQVMDSNGVVIIPTLDDDAFYYQHFKAFIDLEYRDMEGHLELRFDPREIKGRQWFKYNPKGYYELTYNANVKKIFFDWADQNFLKETTIGKTSHIMERLESDCIFTNLWDADPTLDNCLDGLVNLITHEIIPHSAGYMTRKQVPRHYDPTRTAMPDLLNKTLTPLTNKDIILKYFIAIVHKYRDDEMFLMCYGPRGAGKSTLLQIFENLFGIDLVSKTPWKKFGTRFGMKECYDKRVNVCPDLEIKYVSSEAIAMLKNLTGKDGYIEVEKKGIDSFSYPIQCFISFGSNQLPSFVSDAAQEIESVMRRAILAHFPNPMPRDPQFKNDMISPTHLDAVYSFLVNQKVEPILPPNDVVASENWILQNKEIWLMNSDPMLQACQNAFDYSPNPEDIILCNKVQSDVRAELDEMGMDSRTVKNFNADLTERLKIMRITRDKKRAGEGNYINIVPKGQSPKPMPTKPTRITDIPFKHSPTLLPPEEEDPEFIYVQEWAVKKAEYAGFLRKHQLHPEDITLHAVYRYIKEKEEGVKIE